MVIAKHIYSGSHYRTRYYRWWDSQDSRAVLGDKIAASRVTEGEAEVACRQLNQIAGGGFFVMKSEDHPPRATGEAA